MTLTVCYAAGHLFFVFYGELSLVDPLFQFFYNGNDFELFLSDSLF